MKCNKLFFDVKKLRFFIHILSFHMLMWLPLWDKSIKQLTKSVAASKAPALAILEWREDLRPQKEARIHSCFEVKFAEIQNLRSD